jgi:lincosamide nucleotidyltransferase A/C/D/E
MVTAEDAVKIYKKLMKNGMQAWVVGGWGIDALLGEQTRQHKDLDVLMLLDDMIRMQELLGRDGFVLKELWEENLPALDGQGKETDTAFFLKNLDGREIDVHALSPDGQGNWIPAWEDTELRVFTREDLGGDGKIAGVRVQCISQEMQERSHTGYTLPETHVRDLELLRRRFGVSR